MNALLFRIIRQFTLSVGDDNLEGRAWYVVPGRGGPNAVLKIIIPPTKLRGYVLTVARHFQTSVISHEVAILGRLKRSLPPTLCESIPRVVDHGRCEGTEYFAVPFYVSRDRWRVTRRLARERRSRWLLHWLTELARNSLQNALSKQSLEAEYADSISRNLGDPTISDNVKRRIQDSYDLVCRNAGRIPTVCCHGDVWVGNIIWRPRSKGAVVLDWGAARWPGLPCVDLCRFILARYGPGKRFDDAVAAYARAIGLDPAFVPALYDLYKVFVKAEFDEAYATQPHLKVNPFSSENALPSLLPAGCETAVEGP
jgi:thiamine kinase-like enzyme